MAEPIFGSTLEDLSGRLPSVYAEEDAKRDWAFKRYLAGPAFPLDMVVAYLNRFHSTPGTEETSDLVDPATADEEWLPWIAMLRGERLSTDRDALDGFMVGIPGIDQATFQTTGFYSDAGLTPDPDHPGFWFWTNPVEPDSNRRFLMEQQSYQKGTKASIINTMKSGLIESKFCMVFDHSDEGTIGGAGEWDVLVVTREYETIVNPVEFITRAGQKPAGVVLHHRYFEASWDDIMAAFPTWADWNAATWGQIEEAGL